MQLFLSKKLEMLLKEPKCNEWDHFIAAISSDGSFKLLWAYEHIQLDAYLSSENTLAKINHHEQTEPGLENVVLKS